MLDKIIDKLNTGTDYDFWRMPQQAYTYFNQDQSMPLFSYQKEALETINKLFYAYFKAGDTDLVRKKWLWSLYQAQDETLDLAVYKYEGKDYRKVNPKYTFLEHHFPTLDEYGQDESKCIEGLHFVNRACFWMATGSGKSLVLIKTIELLGFLQRQRLIPKKDILLLFSREDLIQQFEAQIDTFNKGRNQKIVLESLKKYEQNQHNRRFVAQETVVYYYRADLLRQEHKERILNYEAFVNHGNWYVFLDEAHRGSADESHLKNYVSAMSRQGFLFNFSATFTDPIDYTSTCFNFNLEKFIRKGYGKHIYLNQSCYNFIQQKSDLNPKDKQKQVLKSLLIFTLIKKSRTNLKLYHAPLMLTLVNSVNTKESDLLLFFREIEKIATGKVDIALLKWAKSELMEDFANHQDYVYGEETLKIDLESVEALTLEDVLEQFFNAQTHSSIEVQEGKAGKELILRLQASESAFALIRIGDTRKFEREKLGKGYMQGKSFEHKAYFKNINKASQLNLLMGSRSFYEGWDSNRPNVLNMINIGRRDAKKFVLQGIGRGIRIEPTKNYRKRLEAENKDKNLLLETLFVFATDRKAVEAIVQAIETQKQGRSQDTVPQENSSFTSGKISETKEQALAEPLGISKASKAGLRTYLNNFDRATLLLKTGTRPKTLDMLLESLEDNSLLEDSPSSDYPNMQSLLKVLLRYIQQKDLGL